MRAWRWFRGAFPNSIRSSVCPFSAQLTVAGSHNRPDLSTEISNPIFVVLEYHITGTNHRPRPLILAPKSPGQSPLPPSVTWSPVHGPRTARPCFVAHDYLTMHKDYLLIICHRSVRGRGPWTVVRPVRRLMDVPWRLSRCQLSRAGCHGSLGPFLSAVM